jgi:hypothetical protein
MVIGISKHLSPSVAELSESEICRILPYIRSIGDHRCAEAPKRRSAEAPKRRSAETPKRRNADVGGQATQAAGAARPGSTSVEIMDFRQNPA